MWLLTPSRAAAAAPERDNELAKQFDGLGVRQQQIAEAHAGRGDDEEDTGGHCLLWTWHMDALRLFEAMSTQWRKIVVGPMGILYEGLRYEALPAVYAALSLRADDPVLFSQLRIMERAGARCLNAGEGAL